MLMARKPLFAMVLGVLFGMSSYAQITQAWWPGYKAQQAQRGRLELPALPEPLVPPAPRDR